MSTRCRTPAARCHDDVDLVVRAFHVRQEQSARQDLLRDEIASFKRRDQALKKISIRAVAPVSA